MGEKDRFDPERHELKLTIQPSAELKKALEGVSLEYVKPEKYLPEIESAYDWGSNTTNQQLTPDNALEITGDNLKNYTEDNEQGVFFINTANATETKAVAIRTSEPKTLILRIPVLETGQYGIEVRNSRRNSKTLRIGVSNMELTVS